MALKTELMASSMPATLANKLGFDTPNTAVAAAGSTQGAATVLTSNFSLVTSGGAGGVILRGDSPTVVSVAAGAGGTITVYPPVGGSINNSAANAGFTVAVGVTAIFLPAGLNWMAIRSA